MTKKCTNFNQFTSSATIQFPLSTIWKATLGIEITAIQKKEKQSMFLRYNSGITDHNSITMPDKRHSTASILITSLINVL